MHIADRLQLPDGYSARPYRGTPDHPAMAHILGAYRASHGDSEQPTAAQFDVNYANIEDCDPMLDIYVVFDENDDAVAYGRTSAMDLDDGTRDCVLFAPALPEHLTASLMKPIYEGLEAHLAAIGAAAAIARYRAYAHHPGPGKAAIGEAAWLESLGYESSEWFALMRRPNLDNIPDLKLPAEVEVRPVDPAQMREIVSAHHECFRGEWDFQEETEGALAWIIDDPRRDETLWQVAWHGDTIVGQVKPYIDHDKNTESGVLLGHAEFISTHHDWRNKGIAGALLARSLRVLRDRGMTEATLGVDTNNPGGALQLYTKLGFELHVYEAVYFKPINL